MATKNVDPAGVWSVAKTLYHNPLTEIVFIAYGLLGLGELVNSLVKPKDPTQGADPTWWDTVTGWLPHSLGGWGVLA